MKPWALDPRLRGDDEQSQTFLVEYEAQTEMTAMNPGIALLLTSCFGLTTITARSTEALPQTQRAAPQQPTNPDGARSFSDLYSVTWEEIPMPNSMPNDPHIITATSITNDGTIAGRGTDALVFWHPDMQAWEELPLEDPVEHPLGPVPVFISPDGSSVIATDYRKTILTWDRSIGWRPLFGITVPQSIAHNVSRNFHFVVGIGSNNDNDEKASLWAINGDIQKILETPDSEDFVAAAASAVSEDGGVVVGNAIRPAQQDGFFYYEYIATRWVGDEPPTILHDPDGRELPAASACDADCSIIFGTGPWFLKKNGEFGSLGTLPDGYPWTDDIYGPYSVTDASSDGSIVVGLYLANRYPQDPNSEVYDDRPFLWTPTTGMTSVRSLGIGDEHWKSIDTVRLSPDARRILISGEDVGWNSRVVVLHLTPKPVSPTAGHSTHAMPTPPRPASSGSLRTGSKLD